MARCAENSDSHILNATSRNISHVIKREITFLFSIRNGTSLLLLLLFQICHPLIFISFISWKAIKQTGLKNVTQESVQAKNFCDKTSSVFHQTSFYM